MKRGKWSKIEKRKKEIMCGSSVFIELNEWFLYCKYNNIAIKESTKNE